MHFLMYILFWFSGNIGKEEYRIENIPDGPTPFRLTRSLFKKLVHEEDDPEKLILNQLKVFCEDLSTELSSGFRKDLNLIENTRNITDFKGMAMQLKKLSPTLLHELDGEKFMKSLKVVIQ